MRAEAVSWDDWSAGNAPPVIDEDKWHVALAPGEVKIVSLEQLDDLFRLSIVDAETKVWQDGMTEWQPLRVIAGIEDEPAPEPKRSHPKPPSPRSAPPPPRPPSAAPAPRSAPPPPRPQSIAPAPTYAAPLAFATTQPAFRPAVASPNLNQFTSVRPLVVSQAPRPAASGGGFGRFLIGLSLVAGVGISLYRNGLVRDAAESLHQPALYARLEAALGGPAFGTLREVEGVPSPHAAALIGLPASTDDARERPTAPPKAVPSAPPVEPAHATPPVVTLESLKPERTAAPAPKADAPLSASPVAPSRATPAPVKAASAPAPAKASAVAKAPSTVAKAAPEKPQPIADKPESEMTAREKLNAAISRSMLSSPPSSKSKSKASEYDPLNPKL